MVLKSVQFLQTKVVDWVRYCLMLLPQSSSGLLQNLDAYNSLGRYFTWSQRIHDVYFLFLYVKYHRPTLKKLHNNNSTIYIEIPFVRELTEIVINYQ